MPESNEAARASGVINTAAREAMAREKTKAFGWKVSRPSALEEAAAQWEQEQKARAQRARDKGPEFSRQGEAPPFSLQRVALQVNSPEGEDGVGWKIHTPPSQKDRRRPQRIGHVPVMSMAQQVIRRARAGAKATGGIGADPRARALEEAARRWVAGQSLGNGRR